MSVYIKHYDEEGDSLTHYGVKGMKWRKHKNNHYVEYEHDSDGYTTGFKVHKNVSGSEYGIGTGANKLKSEAAKRKLEARRRTEGLRNRSLYSKSKSLEAIYKNGKREERRKKREQAKKKVLSVLNKSKKTASKKLRKAEHDTRFGVYNATRKVMKTTGYSSKYSPQEVVKLKKKKREKEYAKNRRAHKVAAKISGINKYLNK